MAMCTVACKSLFKKVGNSTPKKKPHRPEQLQRQIPSSPTSYDRSLSTSDFHHVYLVIDLYLYKDLRYICIYRERERDCVWKGKNIIHAHLKRPIRHCLTLVYAGSARSPSWLMTFVTHPTHFMGLEYSPTEPPLFNHLFYSQNSSSWPQNHMARMRSWSWVWFGRCVHHWSYSNMFIIGQLMLVQLLGQHVLFNILTTTWSFNWSTIGSWLYSLTKSQHGLFNYLVIPADPSRSQPLGRPSRWRVPSDLDRPTWERSYRAGRAAVVPDLPGRPRRLEVTWSTWYRNWCDSRPTMETLYGSAFENCCMHSRNVLYLVPRCAQ